MGVQEGCLGFCCFTIAPGGDLCVVSLFTTQHCVRQGQFAVCGVFCVGVGAGGLREVSAGYIVYGGVGRVGRVRASKMGFGKIVLSSLR